VVRDVYPRWSYVVLLGLALASVEFAAAYGPLWGSYAAYGIALALGVVVYYQGEARVTPGPIFANAIGAVSVGVVVSLVVGTAMHVFFLGAPWDFTLWRVALTLWPAWAGIGCAFVSAFFLTGLWAALS
jgi:hypothetical protein